MKIKIAIADHHLIFRRTLVKFIQDFKNIDIVFEASNSKELIKKLSDFDDVNILLLDLQSAEMEGLKNWQIIQKKYPHIKIIILSHLHGLYYLKYAIHTRVLGYFTKDSDPLDLLKAIQKADEGVFYFEKKLEENVKQINQELKNNPGEDIAKFDFSKRELEIIYWTAKELKCKEVADKLNISPRTVEGHKNNLIKKTNCKSFLGVILIAVELRLITLYGELEF